MVHSSLLLVLSQSSGEPIYKQIVEQVSRMIAGGKLRPGDYLPPVRSLAVQLAVNPMTVSKAYGILELKQWVARERGKGMVVLERQEAQSLDTRLSQLQPIVDELFRQCKQLAISPEEALDWLHTKIKEGV